jgi:hypothetical protein
MQSGFTRSYNCCQFVRHTTSSRMRGTVVPVAMFVVTDKITCEPWLGGYKKANSFLFCSRKFWKQLPSPLRILWRDINLQELSPLCLPQSAYLPYDPFKRISLDLFMIVELTQHVSLLAYAFSYNFSVLCIMRETTKSYTKQTNTFIHFFRFQVLPYHIAT